MKKYLAIRFSFSWLFLICLLLVACWPSTTVGPSNTEPSNQEIAWQTMAHTYDSLAEYMLSERGWTAEELIYVTPISVPELEAVFPDTQFFRGGGRRKYMIEQYLEQGTSAHSLVAVRGGQAYPLHRAAWSEDRTNDGYLAFNRLLRDSGITVTPDNEAMVAKAVVVMMLFVEYDRFFDIRNYDVPERARPAEYQLGKVQRIDRQNTYLGYPLSEQHFTIAFPTWTSQKERVTWWAVAFDEGQLSFVYQPELGLNIDRDNFEEWTLEQNPDIAKELDIYLDGYEVAQVRE